jgi:prephenate dehydrogenase
MRLSHATVAINGLGLMGGSMALALRGKCACVLGVARRPETAQEACRLGVVDHVVDDVTRAAVEADVLVLATPVRHILTTIPEVGPHMRRDALLIDLGSTKAAVVQAMNLLPAHVSAVGGHPMCGKESTGLESADPELYCDAVFALSPTERTSGDAMGLAEELAQAVGAHPVQVDAAEHDAAAAIISHLPYLLAAALVQTQAGAEKDHPHTRTLAASGFRDATRLAAGSVDMMLDILLTNRRNVENALDDFEQQLAVARRLLNEPDVLRRWMTMARRQRRDMF